MTRPWLVLVFVLAFAAPVRAEIDQQVVLTGLVGHPKADILRRLGPPGDTTTTVDGERLFYQRIDAGRFGARAGQGARDDSGDTGLSLHDYSFPCRIEIVIRGGVMTAYNRTGAGCR